MRPRDTDAHAHRAQIESHRAMGPAARVRLALAMSERARAIAIQGTLDRHPGSTYEEARRRVWRHLLGDELFEAAWPDADVG